MAKLPSLRELDFGADLAPDFEIQIEGKDTGEGSAVFPAIRPLIASVSYEEDEEMAALFELTVANQPDDSPGVAANWSAVLDCKAFQEGNSIDLYMGYGGYMEYMGRTEIVKWIPRFPDEGPTTFMIKGFDGRHRMMIGNQYKAHKPKEEAVADERGIQGKGKKHKKSSIKKKKGQHHGGHKVKRKAFFSNMPDEAIVKQIADKYGFDVDCDKTEVRKRERVASRKGVVGKTATTKKQSVIPTRVQLTNQTDWQFLKRLADINRFDLWVDFDREKSKYVVHFKKRVDVAQPEYCFVYNGKNGSLISAEPEFAIHEQCTDIEVIFFDRKKQAIELTTITEEQTSEDVNFRTATLGQLTAKKTLGSGARVRFTAFGTVLEAYADKPFSSRADAETFVKNWLKDREQDLLIMNFKVTGIETLRPRQVHEFRGLGKRLDGYYRFTKIKHVMQPGQRYCCEGVAHKIPSDTIAKKPITKTLAKRSGKKTVIKS